MKNNIFIFLIFITFNSIAENKISAFSNNQLKNDFKQFLNLFTVLSFPVLSENIPNSNVIISKNMVEKFISPYDNESLKATDIKAIGKFKISNNFIAVIFRYNTSTSGDIYKLYIFELNGNFVSDFCLGVDFGSYQQMFKIDNNFQIEIRSTSETNREEMDTKYYIIKDGKIIAQKS